MQRSSRNQPLVSIGMPVYNGGSTIAQAINSILNQTFQQWELLIIDDGSTDHTFETAASFKDSRIVVMRGENKGLSARLNECVSLAKGNFFARMDQDDVSYPRRLQCQVEFLLDHPDVDLVGGSVVVFRNDGTAYGARRSPLIHEQICAHPWRGIPIAHPTWMGKTEWFLENQYRRDSPRMQDQDLLLRTYQKSRFASMSQIVLGYREDSLSLKKILRTRWEMCGMMVRIAREQHMFATAALGIIGLATKGFVDTLAICTGLNYRLLRHRASDISAEEKREWNSVWEQVRFTSDNIRVDQRSRDDASQGALI